MTDNKCTECCDRTQVQGFSICRKCLRRKFNKQETRIKELEELLDSMSQTNKAMGKRLQLMSGSLEYIADHGIPCRGSSEEVWRSCYFSMSKKASQTLEAMNGISNKGAKQ